IFVLGAFFHTYLQNNTNSCIILKKARELNDMKTNLAQAMGVILIIAGVVLFIITLSSFDCDTYIRIKDLTLTYEEEIALMEQELGFTIMTAIVLLFGSAVAGVLLITLGKMLGLLEVIAIKIAGEENKSDDIKENVN